MTAKRTVREWKAKHKSEYDSFKRQVAAIGGGDLTLMERMMTLLGDLRTDGRPEVAGLKGKEMATGKRNH